MRDLFNLSLFLSLSLDLVLAQSVTNVVDRQDKDEIIITYDLVSQSASAPVSISYTTDNGATWQRITDAEGDLGLKVSPGQGKTIRWLISPDVADQTLRFKVNAVDLSRMVWVDGGAFQMGSNSGEPDEKPVHTVTVKGFYMDKYEVTQAEYRRVMGTNPSYFTNCADCPVELVTWHDAMAYAQKVGKRLPTEAEWEYAARGGNQSRGYKYAGSDNLDAVGWYDGNSGGKTHPVGQKQPNELGLYDMSGNVWEWCADWYGENYYAKSPQDNPTGPASGSHRVLRGGSWLNYDYYCPVSSRLRFNPVSRNGDVGFRCVQDF